MGLTHVWERVHISPFSRVWFEQVYWPYSNIHLHWVSKLNQDLCFRIDTHNPKFRKQGAKCGSFTCLGACAHAPPSHVWFEQFCWTYSHICLHCTPKLNQDFCYCVDAHNSEFHTQRTKHGSYTHVDMPFQKIWACSSIGSKLSQQSLFQDLRVCTILSVIRINLAVTSVINNGKGHDNYIIMWKTSGFACMNR